MRLVIDLQGAQSASRYRGIGRYTRSLVRRLVQLADQHEVILFINAMLKEGADALIAEFGEQLPRERIVVFEPMAPLSFSPGNRARLMAMEPLREAMLVDLEPDVVLLTSLFEGYHDDALTSVGAYSSEIPTAVIHYDLIPLSNPEYLSAESQAQFFQRKVEQLQSADLLLAISQASRDDAIDKLDLTGEQVVNIGAAVERGFCPEEGHPARVRAVYFRLGISRAFVLYVPGGLTRARTSSGCLPRLATCPRVCAQRISWSSPAGLITGESRSCAIALQNTACHRKSSCSRAMCLTMSCSRSIAPRRCLSSRR